jgi:hypothetical protein
MRNGMTGTPWLTFFFFLHELVNPARVDRVLKDARDNWKFQDSGDGRGHRQHLTVTDAAFQEKSRETFHDAAVLIIAHRLNKT